MRLKIPKEKYDEIIDLYQNGMSLEKIGLKYEASRHAIKTVLNKMGVQTRDDSHKGRKYTINENYFDEIDTPNKAYILGLLYADGCNHRETNHVNLELQERDKDILDKIKVELETNKPLYFNELNKRSDQWQNAYRLNICNKHISETLEEKGVVPRKSLILEFPEWLPDEFLSHFLRGYMDGDGHIQCFTCRNASFASTENFCLAVQKRLNNIGIESHIHNTQNKENSTRILYIFKISNIIKFLDYIYKDAELYIQRKYDAYQTFLEETKNTNNSLSA